VRLDELAERRGDEISVEWKSFLLRVEPKTGDRDRFIEYTRSWLGPAEAEPRAEFRVWSSDAAQPASSIPAQVAAKVLGRRWPERAGDYHRRLLRAYFSENRNIADSAELMALAADVGVNSDEFESEARLHGDEMTRLVIEEHNSAIDNGVTAVPTVVFAGSFPLPGAQDVATYERILDAINERRSQP